MGFPTSEISYTPAMPKREDHEVHKEMWGHWGKKKSNRQVVTSEKALIWREDRTNMGQWNDDNLLVAGGQSSFKHGSRDGPMQAEEHAARDTERKQWQSLCLSGINDRRLVETSNAHEYTNSLILIAVQWNQVYLHLTDNRENEVMVTVVMIWVYFWHKHWFSPSELDMSSQRRTGFDAKPCKLEFRLIEEAAGKGELPPEARYVLWSLQFNYSRTAIIRKLVIRIANYADQLGPWGKSVENSVKLSCRLAEQEQ